MLPFLQLAHMVDVTQHMGWGGDVTVLTTCTHGGCSATTGVGGWCYNSYNLHTWWMLRNTWGGGMMLPFLQLAHMVDVPQHMGWGGDVTVLATCTHGRCYATTGVRGWCYHSYNLHTWWMFRNTWGGGVMLPFLQLAHMVDVHSKSEWTRKVKVRGRNKVASTQQIDRFWFHLKKFCPKQMKSRTGPTLNGNHGRFWDRIY